MHKGNTTVFLEINWSTILIPALSLDHGMVSPVFLWFEDFYSEGHFPSVLPHRKCFEQAKRKLLFIDQLVF